jgi:CheY-like chemotaxis protein
MPSKHVLILDDHTDHIQALTGHFAKFGHPHTYEVAHASTGAEAAMALRRGRPDLILIDPQMTGLDGLALLKQVRALDRTIPVIVVSAKQGKGVAAEVLKLGVFAYVPKPCEYLQLEHLAALAFSDSFRAAGSA